MGVGHGFEIWTGPYGPTRLTRNHFLKWFLKLQNLFYTIKKKKKKKNLVDRVNCSRTVQFENRGRFSRFQSKLEKKKTLSTFYRLTEVDLHYCSFNTLLDLRSHHSFFSFFFSILLSLVFFLSQYSSFSLLSCYFCVFAFSFAQLDCQPQLIFLGFDFKLVDKTIFSFPTLLGL